MTIALARYDTGDGVVHLVVRTPPGWADAGQRISLALWDRAGPCRHPHPHPDRRFRLDLHRHLWDARRSDELRTRCGADRPAVPSADPLRERGCAVDRWAAEAAILLRAQGRTAGTVTVRLWGRRRLLLRVGPATARGDTAPVLPDAATWTLPDLELLRAGLIDADRLHPLVAAALVPDRVRAAARRAAGLPDRGGPVSTGGPGDGVAARVDQGGAPRGRLTVRM
ncbi:hypothetical protein Prum_099190 [Phytohabitans rumicis]|uniref:Uncharacterized protein n=1 Tax=Phytohabitans rumicis TaxID=1076125 RepID=A0A6V8LQ73_9ACTN|nr:hypothetical protein Prum_099190 [Phytohabitans rumicis]